MQKQSSPLQPSPIWHQPPTTVPLVGSPPILLLQVLGDTARSNGTLQKKKMVRGCLVPRFLEDGNYQGSRQLKTTQVGPMTVAASPSPAWHNGTSTVYMTSVHHSVVVITNNVNTVIPMLSKEVFPKFGLPPSHILHS